MLLIAGEWERRREMLSGLAGVPTAYIPGVLTAAGTVVAFGTVYAAYVLYGFIGAPLAFLLLGAVALATLAAALIHGPALAGLGLAGAYVTPALVASETPNYWALVIYLAIVSAAALALASARRWRWLAIASVVLGVLWTFPGIGDPAALPAHLFHVAAGLALVAIFVVSGLLFGPDIAPGEIEFESSGAARRLSRRRRRAGLCHVARSRWRWLVSRRWSRQRWQSPGGPKRRRSRCRRPPCSCSCCSSNGRCGATAPPTCCVAIPFARDEHLPDPVHLAIGAGLGVLFGVAGLRVQGRSSQALISIAWSASGALLPILLLMTLYWAATNGFERALAFALAGLATAFLYSAATESLMRRPPRPGSATAAALYATAAVAALALTLTFSFDRGWLSVGLALMVPGIAWVHLRRPLPVLRSLAAVLVAVVTARTLWEPRIIGEALGSTPILNWLLYGYGVPAGAFWLAGFLLRRRGDDGATRTAESGAIVFTVLLFFLEIRHFLNGGDIYRPSSGLTEVALQVSVAVALAIGLERVRERTRSIVHNIGAVAVAGFAVVAALAGLMLVRNPLWTGIDVGGPFANLLLLAYLLPAALFAILERITQASRGPAYRTMIGGMSVGLAFLYLSLEVGRLYRGPVLTPTGIGDAEFYTYRLSGSLMPSASSRRAGSRGMPRTRTAPSRSPASLSSCWQEGLFADHDLTADGADVGGLFVNLMAPAFLAPALLLAFFAVRERRPERAPFRAAAETAAVALGLVYLTLELMRFYRGPVLSAAAMSDAEYYTYPILWLVYAIGLAELRRWTQSVVLEWATLAIAGIAALAIAAGLDLFVGRNLVTDGADVGGLFLNLTALAYLLPAVLFAVLAAREQRPERARFRGAAEIAAIVLTFGYLTLEVTRFYRGPILSAIGMSDAEFYTYPVLWLAGAIALSELRRWTQSAVQDWAAGAIAGLAVFTIAIGWIAGRDLTTDGTDVGGLFLNLMVPAYLAPALLLTVLAELEERPERAIFRTAAEIGTLVLAVAFLSLELMRFYRGPILADVAMSDAEYYTYPLLWLACAVGLTGLWRRTRRTVHDIAAVALAGLAVATIGAGFLFGRNLWTDAADVGGLVLNAMLAGFLGTAVLVGILARGERRAERAWYRIGGAIVAVALMFLYLSLEVTRFHRGPVLAPAR